jgi:hypothetical protein
LWGLLGGVGGLDKLRKYCCVNCRVQVLWKWLRW